MQLRRTRCVSFSHTPSITPSNKSHSRAWNQYASDAFTIPARSEFRQEIVTSYAGCDNNCGVVYKIAKEWDFGRGHITQLEYSSRDGIMYFDISFVDCAKNLGYRTGDASDCPTWERGIHINGGDNSGCGSLDCPAQSMCM
jgi:hypothetical protein